MIEKAVIAQFLMSATGEKLRPAESMVSNSVSNYCKWMSLKQPLFSSDYFR